jgi:hypothetical protein
MFSSLKISTPTERRDGHEFSCECSFPSSLSTRSYDGRIITGYAVLAMILVAFLYLAAAALDEAFTAMAAMP